MTTILSLTISACGIAQQSGISYRTATDTKEKRHYLIFNDKSNCKLIFVRTHADALFPQKWEFDLKYRVVNDTITFYGAQLDSANLVVSRLLRSKFIIISRKQIFDTVSGYTYVDKRLVSDEQFIFAYEGKIYKQTLTSDGYGLALKRDKLNARLRRKIKRNKEENLKLVTVTGKAAYDKYGLLGMNGVIEITEKK